MTKKWSSTRSLDGQTKRQASKRYRRGFVGELLRVDRLPPEAVFENAEDMLAYLNSEDLSRNKY